MRWLHIVSALFRDGGPSGIVINTGPFEHIGFAIFAIEAAGALVRGVLLRRLIIQAALRARKHDRGLCYGGHPAIMRRWLAGSIRYCPGFEGTRAPNVAPGMIEVSLRLRRSARGMRSQKFNVVGNRAFDPLRLYVRVTVVAGFECRALPCDFRDGRRGSEQLAHDCRAIFRKSCPMVLRIVLG